MIVVVVDHAPIVLAMVVMQTRCYAMFGKVNTIPHNIAAKRKSTSDVNIGDRSKK